VLDHDVATVSHDLVHVGITDERYFFRILPTLPKAADHTVPGRPITRQG
jgi:hypothetical protein